MTAPKWHRRLLLAVGVADAQRAFDDMLGRGASLEFEQARRAVVAVIDAALADGADESEVDAVLRVHRDRREAPCH